MESTKLLQRPLLQLEHPDNYSKENINKVIELYNELFNGLNIDSEEIKNYFLNPNILLNDELKNTGHIAQPNILVHDLTSHVLLGMSTDPVPDCTEFYHKDFYNKDYRFKTVKHQLNRNLLDYFRACNYYKKFKNKKRGGMMGFNYENSKLNETFEDFYSSLTDDEIYSQLSKGVIKSAFYFKTKGKEEKLNKLLDKIAQPELTVENNRIDTIRKEQYRVWRINSEMIDMMSIALPKMLEGKGKKTWKYTWENIYGDSDVQPYLRNIAEINRQFNDPECSNSFDSYTDEGKEFWEMMTVKSNSFYIVMKRFLDELYPDREYYMELNNRNIL